MLSDKMISSVTADTLEYWKQEVEKPVIVGIAKGKEIGHKLADLVDEKTTALLTLKYITAHQRSRAGVKRSRSMGDVWLRDGNIYHAVNVKTGIVGSEGQPNLVSLKKVLRAIMQRQIDSYYLLIVKMAIGPNTIAPSVYFVDMLDWLDYVTFDSGPGQMMLRAVRFFQEYDPDRPAKLDIQDKVRTLMELYEDGEKRLRQNRERDFGDFQKDFERFMKDGTFAVTPDTQGALRLQ